MMHIRELISCALPKMYALPIIIAVRYGLFRRQFRNGKRHGHGILIHPDKTYYNGEWDNGEMKGNGIYQTANGDRYEGKWNANKKQGKGRYIWTSNDIFEGEFVNDQITVGKLLRADGTVIDINVA